MRHHGRRRGSGMGGGWTDFDDFDGPRRGFRGAGLGLHHFGYGGGAFGRPSTRERIEYLEEVQRDLEEMTADVASQLDWLRQRASEQSTS